MTEVESMQEIYKRVTAIKNSAIPQSEKEKVLERLAVLYDFNPDMIDAPVESPVDYEIEKLDLSGHNLFLLIMFIIIVIVMLLSGYYLNY